MTNKTRLYALVCILASGVAFYGCDDGDAVGSTHNSSINKPAECTTNADCADKGDKTECSSDGVCVAPAATPECTTNDDCADKGDKTECSSDGVCVAPAVTPECTTNDDCADKGDKTECNDAGICVVPAVCDNGTLEDGEECDGLLVAENLDLDCGENRHLIDTPLCIPGICKIDLTQSCVEIQKECEVDDDCADKEEGKTKCDVDNGICVVPPECEVDDDCADKEEGKTKCDVDNGICVVPPECEVDDDCADKEEGKTKCDVDNGVCVVPPECESHADCAGKEDGRTRCDVAQNTCYAPECEADEACADNAEGKTKCDVENGVCVVPPECVVDDDCANKEDNKNICNTEKGICVQCTQDVHCASCSDNRTQCNVAEGMCVEPSVVVDPEKPVTYKECNYPDEDKDGISDEIEGKEDNRDSDNDGIPDYQDLDSDGDTIPDSIEGGTHGCSSALPIDSDRDGTPDYLDTDSDNNGVMDAIECAADAVDANGLATACIDTDNDSYPDYADSDNDGDYISDLVEIVGMVNPKDTSLAADEFSGDCDKDGKPDKKGNVANPIDCDGDNIPDYMDTDSDGDKISDVDEGQGLVNGGKFYSHYMTDADGDGVPDGTECGGKLDANGLYLNCLDSNGNGIPDYLELDSDSDGISDTIENQLGSDPTKEDTDGDGTPDLIEYYICVAEGDSACSAITDKNDNPVSRGDFVFVTPYKKETTPDKQTLSLETAIQTIDIFFTFDRTGSMDAEIKSLAQKLDSIITELQCKDLGGADCIENQECEGRNGVADAICSEDGRCIANPRTANAGKGCFNSMWTGVGYYSYADTFFVASHLNSDSSVATNAMKAAFKGGYKDDYTSFCSYGNGEPPYQMPICAAIGMNKYEGVKLCNEAQRGTPQVCTSTPQVNSCGTYGNNCGMNCTTDSTKVGCVGYRPDAIHVYVQAFDEEQCYSTSNGSDWRTRCTAFQSNVGKILKEYKMRFIGLWSGSSSTYKDYADTSKQTVSMEYVAKKIGTDSGSVNSLGEPYAYEASDDQVGAKTADAVRDIAKTMRMDITSTVEDIDANASKLVKELHVNLADTSTPVVAQGRTCTKVTEKITSEKKNPGTADEQIFEGVEKMLPGNVLCYDVIPVQNQSIFPADKKVPKIYKARVKVIGDGSVLNSGVAYFLVPPEFEKQ